MKSTRDSVGEVKFVWEAGCATAKKGDEVLRIVCCKAVGADGYTWKVGKGFARTEWISEGAGEPTLDNAVNLATKAAIEYFNKK